MASCFNEALRGNCALFVSSVLVCKCHLFQHVGRIHRICPLICTQLFQEMVPVPAHVMSAEESNLSHMHMYSQAFAIYISLFIKFVVGLPTV